MQLDVWLASEMRKRVESTFVLLIYILSIKFQIKIIGESKTRSIMIIEFYLVRPWDHASWKIVNYFKYIYTHTSRMTFLLIPAQLQYYLQGLRQDLNYATIHHLTAR